jgi:hypothetical protein
MAMHRALRSLITILVALSILLAVPLAAGARGSETPQLNLRAAESWVDAAFGWLQDFLALQRPASHPHSSNATGVSQQKDANTSGGSCIDPQGNRYPPPCIRD